MLLLGGEKRLALPVIRALGTANAEIHFAAPSKTETAYSRYLSAFHLIEDSEETAQLEQILNFIRKNSIDVFLPIDEVATQFIIRNQQQLSQIVALPPLPTKDLLQQVIHKEFLNNWLKDKQLPYAKFQPLTSNYLSDELECLQFPVLLKPVWDGGGNAEGINVQKFNTLEEITAYLADKKPEANSCIIQEYIPGHDIDCSLLCENGSILAYTMQKGFILKSLQYSPGIEILFNRSFFEQIQTLIAKLNWSGICHLDFRFDERDNSYKLVDFNARFWTTLLGSLVAGVNFPDLTCRTALGESYPLPKYHCKRFVLAQLALRNLLTLKHWNSYSLRETGLYYSMKDPLPDLVNAKSIVRRLKKS